jgi:Beta-xylosidase
MRSNPTFSLLLASCLSLALVSCASQSVGGHRDHRDTYCNPLDIDYTYAVFDSDRDLSYRSGADPAVVEFKGEYYLFVTRSMGYWHSKDLLDWDFITPGRNWYPQGCNAPAAHNYRDSLLFVTGDPSGEMSVLYSSDPSSGNWNATPSILHNLQDPDLFIDDDGSAYMFWGSSNDLPIRGERLDMRNRFKVSGPTVPLFSTDSTRHGWERFGENHKATSIAAFIEGAWMTKHDGKYYLQYAAPGTEFNVYGDGVYVADSVMGPYTYQRHNPICYKPGGFMNGAGHGSTMVGPQDQYWHFASMSLSAIANWERRLCMFPTFFDAEGTMYCDTDFGDYPHYSPESKRKGEFTGWMLLSYKSPVTASSFQEGSAPLAQGFSEFTRPETSKDFKPENVTDENCKTYWFAKDNDDSQWIVVDLLDTCDIYALQINFFDHKSNLYGRVPGQYQKFLVDVSEDGNEWHTVVDRHDKAIDSPNAYCQLPKPVAARYVRYRNVRLSMPNLAISGFRIFGKGRGDAPDSVSNCSVVRSSDCKSAFLKWDPVKGAQGYDVKWGIAPDKLYSSWLIYDDCQAELRCLSSDERYYFTVESFNSNGISKPCSVLKAD